MNLNDALYCNSINLSVFLDFALDFRTMTISTKKVSGHFSTLVGNQPITVYNQALYRYTTMAKAEWWNSTTGFCLVAPSEEMKISNR